MGTNYYAVVDHCPSCLREDRLHICKSHTTFQGHFKEVSKDGITWEAEPWLTSWANWKAYLLSDIDLIIDDYDGTHTVHDFIAAVESTNSEARRRQYGWVVANPTPYRKIDVVQPDADWLDEDGFSFYGGGFS